MKNLFEIIETIKREKRLENDIEVADLLGIKRKTLATAKIRNSIPFEALTSFCSKENISLNWLLTGEGLKYQEERLMPGMINESPAEYADKKLNDLVKKLHHIYNEGSVQDRALIRGTIDEVYDILIDKIVSRTKDPAAEPALKKNHAG